MRILIDIGHPAHVHLFKNLAFEMSRTGHEFFFTIREGENQEMLLKECGFTYKVIGEKKSNKILKLFGIITFSVRIYFIARQFRPDLFLSHGSMYAGYAAFLYRRKHIALEDTGNMEQIFFSKPVSDVILTPEALKANLGKKQIRYKGFHELAYLHPKRFIPDSSALELLGLKANEPYVIIRFVKWNATHDIGHSGLTLSQKIELVNRVSERARVFISAESTLPGELKKYTLNIPPHKLHDLLFYASLYIGEGATTASECAMLGTPSLFFSTISAGTLLSQESYGLLKCYRKYDDLLQQAYTILKNPSAKAEIEVNRRRMLNENMDVTSFLIWFVKNFPKSKDLLSQNPSLQNSFISPV